MDKPQPEVHIRADKEARYEYVGKVITDAQRAGIQKVAFITQPEHGSVRNDRRHGRRSFLTWQ